MPALVLGRASAIAGIRADRSDPNAASENAALDEAFGLFGGYPRNSAQKQSGRIDKIARPISWRARVPKDRDD
jgi:hypothetical protein